VDVIREELVKTLALVSPGLCKADVLQQSSCFVFKDGKIWTFNDEIACSIDSPLEIEAAIPATQLQALLTKLREDMISIDCKDGELSIKGKGRRAGIRCENEIKLPVEGIERPGEWFALPENFSEALSICQGSVSKEQNALANLHIMPDWIEACDNYQIVRYELPTGFSGDVLIRGESLKQLASLEMTEASETENWVHFTNLTGLVVSCRKSINVNYPKLGDYLDKSGSRVVLPAGLVEAVGKARIFSAENNGTEQIKVDLRPGKLLLKGQGVSGWYEEQQKVDYDGEPMVFVISPQLLIDILKKTQECLLSDRRLVIDGGKFTYVGCLGQAE